MLTRNHRQEGLCKAYIQAVAAACGMSTSTPSPDYGIDLTVNDIEAVGKTRIESGFKLDIQAKSVIQAATAGPTVPYDLEVGAYNLLRHPAPGTPRLLVVLFLPEEEANWLSLTEHELILRRCACWLSLRGRGPTKNRRSIRLDLPRDKLFSADALREIMSRVKTGGEP